MFFQDIYTHNTFVLSFELFPPKTDKGMDNLIENVGQLLKFEPHFITCTYGAGGSTREKTLDTLAQVQTLTHIPLASHLTCVNATVEELKAYLQRAAAQGIENIVAIRGDAPEGEEQFQTTDGGLTYGSDLVKLIRGDYPDFGIAVGGYPETHPEAQSPEADLQHLKEKIDCGADLIITQLFYNNDDFLRFRERCTSMGINVPIVPGLLPVTNFNQVKRIASLCGATLPKDFLNALENSGDDAEAQFDVGVQQATRQAADLIAHGVPGIHFYVLNKSRATSAVLSAVTLPSR